MPTRSENQQKSPPAPEPATAPSPDRVRDISEAVYRNRLGGDLERMLAEDNDGGRKLRERAGAYDTLTRAYLRAVQRNL